MKVKIGLTLGGEVIAEQDGYQLWSRKIDRHRGRHGTISPRVSEETLLELPSFHQSLMEYIGVDSVYSPWVDVELTGALLKQSYYTDNLCGQWLVAKNHQYSLRGLYFPVPKRPEEVLKCTQIPETYNRLPVSSAFEAFVTSEDRKACIEGAFRAALSVQNDKISRLGGWESENGASPWSGLGALPIEEFLHLSEEFRQPLLDLLQTEDFVDAHLSLWEDGVPSVEFEVDAFHHDYVATVLSDGTLVDIRRGTCVLSRARRS